MKGKIKEMRILIGDHTNTLFKRDLADFTVKKDRKQPPSISQSPTEASVHGHTMKAKHSDLMSGIKIISL